MVPEPVDVDYFNPAGVEPLELPRGQLVFGRARSEAQPVAFLSVRSCWNSSVCLPASSHLHVHFSCLAACATWLDVARRTMLHFGGLLDTAVS